MLKKLYILTSPLPLAAFFWVASYECSLLKEIEGWGGSFSLAYTGLLWFVLTIISFLLATVGIALTIKARLQGKGIFTLVLATILSSLPFLIFPLGIVRLVQVFVPGFRLLNCQ